MKLKEHRHFTHHYKGFSQTPCKCHIDIFQLEEMTDHGHDTIVLFTALQDNQGTSITNASETIATDMVIQKGVNISSTFFVEVYPHYDNEYAAIFYKYDPMMRKFHSGRFKPLKKFDEEYVDFIEENKSYISFEQA